MRCASCYVAAPHHVGVEGVSHTGQPTSVGFIKVEMLENSAKQWIQLVEVLAK